MRRPTTRHAPLKTVRPSRRDGFTLIELLVAMSVLVIIVLIISMVFQRASVVWDAGMNKAELDMTGRAVADYVAQDLSSVVTNTAHTFNVTAQTADFYVLGDATLTDPPITKVSYSYGGGTLTRNGITLVEGLKDFVFSPEPAGTELPLYIEVTVTATNEANVESRYQSRAYFMNRNRYKL